VQGQRVTLWVHVSRWRCRQEGCTTQVFTKRLPGVCAPHARRTRRFAEVIQWVGYALGGRGGERLLDRLGLTVSDDTVVRTLKRTAAAVTSPEVLRKRRAVWAFRHRHAQNRAINVNGQIPGGEDLRSVRLRWAARAEVGEAPIRAGWILVVRPNTCGGDAGCRPARKSWGRGRPGLCGA
jgi:hypothetical protein